MDKDKVSEDKLKKIKEEDRDYYACSASDCTGLIPAMPEDEDGLELYEEIYPYITMPVENHK